MKNGSPLLVTGASGMLGAAVVAAAAVRNPVVACHGRNPFQWPGVISRGVDLLSPAATEQLLYTIQPGCIIHLAAATQIDQCEQFPAAADELNAVCTRRLAEWAARHGAVFVYMSTDSVFAGTRGSYQETDLTEPVNHYARSKLAGERAVQASGGEHLIIRGNIFGWNAQPKQNLAEWVLAKLECGETVPGFTDIIFNPLLVNTLASIILDLLEHGCRGIVHTGCASPLSKFDFACKLAGTFGHPVKQVIPTLSSAAPLPTPRPNNTSLDCTKLARILDATAITIDQELQTFRELRSSGFVSMLKSSIIPL